MSKNSVFDIFVSTRTMATLLAIFAIAIGAATFIENYYDTIAAQRIVFHAVWFKVVLLLLCVNFIGNIKRYNLFRKEKWAVLLIHFGMIGTIIGAGVTHYIGFEGIIRVKEGEVVNKMWTSQPYLEIFQIDEASGQSFRYPLLMKPTECPLLSNDFEFTIDPFNTGQTTVSYVEYLAKRNYGAPIDSSENGINSLELVFAGMVSEYLPEGGFFDKGNYTITYNYPQPDAINITGVYPDFEIEFPVDVMRLSMATQETDTLAKGKHPFEKKHLHNLGDLNIVFKKFHYKMDKPLIKDDAGQDRLTINIEHNGESKNIMLWGGAGYMPGSEAYVVGGKTFYARFGATQMDLPFTFVLDDFILETYAGSERPSGYRSEVTVFDNMEDALDGKGTSHSIFMNNVLDYKGYRVFQSSYDEIGGVEVSVFSVNHDFWGTWITYIAYTMLSIGFIFTLFNKTSRFRDLGKRLKKMSVARKAITSIALLAIASQGVAQQKTYTPVSQEHCDNFNELLVLSYSKRIEPCNSLAYDLIRKLTRKDKWTLEEYNVTLSPEQFLLDMFVSPGFWAKQPVMKFNASTGLGDELGVEGNYMAFTDIITIESNENGEQFVEPKIFKKQGNNGEDVFYTFDSLVKWAEMKPLGKRMTFDKEVIKLNEKVSIFWQVTQGDLFRIFPIVKDSSEVWVNWLQPEAQIDISNGALGEGNVITASMLIRQYLNELLVGKETGDYSSADMMVEKLKEYQRSQYSENPEALPSESLIRLEISYNKMNLFSRLKYFYALLGLILLPLALAYNLKEKPSKTLHIIIKSLIALYIVCLALHLVNLGLRTYIIGHAPWSDGYEALITVSAACIIAGLLFMSRSYITVGAAALIGFFVMMTAGHNQYDPQMSDLEPVLKSYWLNIHVACLTVSYGFFALGFILTLINMGIFAFRGDRNKKRTDITIKELTFVNEQTMTIGLVLATIGTFLGGVWANESWGRYWGWDAKETWALVIVLVYAFILHMRFVPGLKSKYALNLASGIGFASVIMTFVGVNYYLTKGLHSYARGETPAFPGWAWITIFAIIGLFTLAGIKQNKRKAATSNKELIDK